MAIVLNKFFCFCRKTVVGSNYVDLTKDDMEQLRLITLSYGDISGDGQIGPDDLALMLSGENYMRETKFAANILTDLNNDGQIGPDDLAILLNANNYMKGTPKN